MTSDSGRVWLVTGCDSGMGHHIAETALKNGDSVAARLRRIRSVVARSGAGFGGDYAEEDAVCYLQVLLIDRIAALTDSSRFNRLRLFADMDAWGYTFRLGSAQRWFETDADEARSWLEQRGMLAPGARAAS